MSRDKYASLCKDWFEQANRVGKAVVFTSGIANICFYPQPYWIICWHKPAAVSFNRMGGFNAWEPISVHGEPRKRLGQDYILFNTFNFSKGPEKDHPCPKPLGLWEKLINLFSEEGDTILDPFLGSGTTAVACERLGRNWIGIEIDADYCKIAEKRIATERAQVKLFKPKELELTQGKI